MVLTKNEVEADIKDKGDFVKIDHLKRFLLRADSLDVKKFILVKLAEINESHGFYNEAAKNYDSIADIVITYKDKIDTYMKEVYLFVRAEQFDIADKVFLKVMAFANTKEREAVQEKLLGLYEDYGKALEKENKYRKAITVYNKLFSLQQKSDKKAIVKEKLLGLYLKLGMTHEYNFLSRQSVEVIKQPNQSEKKPDVMREIGLRRW